MKLLLERARSLGPLCLTVLVAATCDRPALGLAGTLNPWVAEGRLFGSKQQSTWNFGASVALSEGRALVGASSAAVEGETQQGEAYIFRFENGAWVEEQRLTASDGDATDFFGWSVALDGDTAFVGAFAQGDGSDLFRGAVYVFRRFGAVWLEVQKLQASDGDAQDHFGIAIDFDHGTLLVGARGSGPGNATGGAAYAFINDGSEWVEEDKLFDPLTEPSHAFGGSVSLRGERALIGARNDGHGTAYTFTRSGDVWSLEQKLEASDASTPSKFGWSVALWGQTAAVGAPQKPVDGDDRRGLVYVFRLDEGTWTEVQQLSGSGTHMDSKFGESLAIEGNTLLVDAEEDFQSQNQQGIVYEFRDIDSNWSEIQKFRAPMGDGLDDFGEAMAFDRGKVIIGNSGNFVVSPLGGTAWIFLKPAIFQDGFESGTTARWDTVVPGAD